jgi:hypothetical protein
MSDPAGTLALVAKTVRLDRGALCRILHRQQRVISREQAIACGATPGTLRHWIRPGGPWQRVLPGVYLAATGTPTLAQTEIAALLYAGPGSVITGLSALRHHGMRVPENPCIPILVPAGRTRVDMALVTVLPTSRMPERVCCDGAIRFTLPPRAVADAARRLTSFREVRALVAGSVQQGRCRIDWLGDEVRNGPVRNSAWLRRALAEVADGIRSVAEGDLRDLLIRAGLPMPMFNARLYAGQTFIAIADAWWPDAGVAVEVDSREWHLSPEDWEHTIRRGARMSAHGIIVLHVTPRQIRAQAADLAADIDSALSRGRARPVLAIRALPSAG